MPVDHQHPKVTNWTAVAAGMSAARSVKDVGAQATSDEARQASGPDFLGPDSGGGRSPDWHLGFDHAVLLARRE